MLLAVSDIEAARSELIAHGVDASQVFHCETGTTCRFSCIGGRVTGPHPERLRYYSFVSFSDPEGNGWLLQEVTKRLAGRVAGKHNVCIGTRSCPGDDSRCEGPWAARETDRAIRELAGFATPSIW
jgi:hypothetical protein